jgi:hypothetical protein
MGGDLRNAPRTFVGGAQLGMSQSETTGRTIERLLVRPRGAWQLLGCGNTYGYELINSGELDSFVEGHARWITVESIHRYIARKLAAASAIGTPTELTSQRPRRGRPPKTLANEKQP